jgi:tetratricopeptide (TPR) repeat protein
MLVATALYEAGHSEEAEAAFREVLAERPDDGVARIGLVEALLSRRSYEEAAREAALEPAGSALEAAAAGAELFARAAAGDATSLAGVLERAPERTVRDVDVELYRAWRAQLAGAPLPAVVPAAAADTALTALEALLRVQDFTAFATLLPVYESIDLDPAARRDALARVYLVRGYLESAAEEWIAAYGERPDASSLIGLAQVAFARGLADEAREFAEHALALAPDDPRAARLVTSLEERITFAGSSNAAACR